MTIYQPYTYLIGWSKYNIWYYGSQYGKKSNPTNLWTTYFTSSKEVKKFRELYGEPDVVEVRRLFLNEQTCRVWEYKVLKRLSVSNNDMWLNKTAGNERFYIIPGTQKRTDETKKLQAEKTRQFWNTPEGQKKKSRLAERNRETKPLQQLGANNGNAKKYEIISPDGTIHIICGELRKFCKKNKLSVGCIINVAKGREHTYKGWSVKYI